MQRTVDETIKILKILSQVEPRRYKAASVEKKASKISWWLLAVSFVFLAIALIFILSYQQRPAASWAQLFVISMTLVSTILALLALTLPMIATVVLLFHWKTLSFEGLCADMQHELAIAAQLATYDFLVLKDAKFWLERKAERISSRTALFFGEKTAALALLALSYSFAEKFGGFNWIATTLAAGVRWDNLGNAVLLGAGAFLLGMSIGSILLAQVVARYRFQIELIELADR